MLKLKDLIKEWNDESFKDLPKRWSNTSGLTEFEQLGGKDIIAEGKNEYASIYNMKEEMKEGKFDPKNPTIHVSGWGVISLEGLEGWIKKDLTKIAKDVGGELSAKNMVHHFYRKHSPLEAKIKGLDEVYKQMNTSQYKRAVTLYKRRR
tara:strand:+ start:215 stop:661 length:447 start_codon:yes stop_codon:yes gene_type:complete